MDFSPRGESTIHHAYRRQRVFSPADYSSCYVETMKYVPFSVDETSVGDGYITREQIEALVSEAKYRAEEIIHQARLDADNIRDKAFQSGYESGQDAAIKEIREAMEPASQLFKNGLEELASLKNDLLRKAEGDIIQLTLSVAKKLACVELKQNPDAIVAVVKEAIKAAKDSARDSEITIRIHPGDRAVLEQYMGELVEHLKNFSFGVTEASAGKLRLEDDPDMTPGGCVVVTDTSIIDMTFESRAESILSALK